MLSTFILPDCLCWVCDKAMLAALHAGDGSHADVCAVLGQLRGPYAFAYLQRGARRLWFGRDFFGRRSLVWSWRAGAVSLASVAGTDDPS